MIMKNNSPPPCASIANRSMIPVPETLLAVNILTDILREIIKKNPFRNSKPIQPPWDLSRRIISLNYFPQNSTNINICIYNQLYSSHSLYLYIYCCYYHILHHYVIVNISKENNFISYICLSEDGCQNLESASERKFWNCSFSSSSFLIIYSMWYQFSLFLDFIFIYLFIYYWQSLAINEQAKWPTYTNIIFIFNLKQLVHYWTVIYGVYRVIEFNIKRDHSKCQYFFLGYEIVGPLFWTFVPV